MSRYLKSSKDELKNKNNKLKPYYLLTHMNFLVPYTKTLDSKSDSVVCNKTFDDSQYDEDMKEDEPSFEHEIIQDEDSANDEMEGNIVYEAYEITEPIPTSSANAQSQTKSLTCTSSFQFQLDRFQAHQNSNRNSRHCNSMRHNSHSNSSSRPNSNQSNSCRTCKTPSYQYLMTLAQLI